MMKQAGFKNIRVKTSIVGLTQICYGGKVAHPTRGSLHLRSLMRPSKFSILVINNEC